MPSVCPVYATIKKGPIAATVCPRNGPLRRERSAPTCRPSCVHVRARYAMLQVLTSIPPPPPPPPPRIPIHTLECTPCSERTVGGMAVLAFVVGGPARPRGLWRTPSRDEVLVFGGHFGKDKSLPYLDTWAPSGTLCPCGLYGALHGGWIEGCAFAALGVIQEGVGGMVSGWVGG